MGWPIDRDSFEDVDDLSTTLRPKSLASTPKRRRRSERSSACGRSRPAALGYLLRQVRAEAAPRRRAAPHPEPGRAQEARLRQQRRARRLGRRRPALRLQLRRGRRAADQLRPLLPSRGRHDLPTLKVLGWDNLDTALHLDAVAEKLTQQPRLARRRQRTSRPGADAGAPLSPCATARSSPPRRISRSGWRNWPAPSATASRPRSPSRPRPARSPS